MLNIVRLWLVLTVGLAGVFSPRFALCLMVSGAALGCYTLLVLALPQLRRPAAALLRKAGS